LVSMLVVRVHITLNMVGYQYACDVLIESEGWDGEE
jgi:hypothetical protein